MSFRWTHCQVNESHVRWHVDLRSLFFYLFYHEHCISYGSCLCEIPLFISILDLRFQLRTLVNSFIVVLKRCIPLKFCGQISCSFLNMGMVPLLCRSSGVFVSYKILLNSCEFWVSQNAKCHHENHPERAEGSRDGVTTSSTLFPGLLSTHFET